MKHLFAKRLTKLWRNQMGGVFVYAAIAAPVLIGAAGLSVDIGLWYANKRLVQSAVDSAALAGALEFRRSNGDPNSIINVVYADALNNGYSLAEGDDFDIDSSVSPLVSVTITRTVPGLLSQVLFTDTTNVQARAVARADVNDSCIWSLNPTEEKAIRVGGTADVNLGCGMLANTSDPDGIWKEGSGCMSASEYKVTGGYDDTLNSGCVLSPIPETSTPPVDDPLASLPPPSYTPCSGGGPPVNLSGTADYTVSAGVHCTNITVTTSGTVTFETGIHIFDGAGLNLNGGTSEGTEVSFYWSENSSGSDGFDIAGTATVNLSAPISGAYAGILVYVDRDVPQGSLTHTMTGGTNANLDGIIYAPTTTVKFAGGAAANSSSIVIIADMVEFKGGDTFLGDFDTSTIMNNALMLQAKLVE